MKDIEKIIELSRRCAPTILAGAALCIIPCTYIEWMPQVNEAQIYEAYNEYKELGI